MLEVAQGETSKMSTNSPQETAVTRHVSNGLAGLLGVIGCFAGLAAFGQSAPTGGKGVCILAHLIDHTEIVDENTILFHMTGRKIWKNTLTAPCHTLTRDDGFAYEPKVDRLCSNLEHIHVIRTGEVCLLGEFTPYDAPKRK